MGPLKLCFSCKRLSFKHFMMCDVPGGKPCCPVWLYASPCIWLSCCLHICMKKNNKKKTIKVIDQVPGCGQIITAFTHVVLLKSFCSVGYSGIFLMSSQSLSVKTHIRVWVWVKHGVRCTQRASQLFVQIRKTKVAPAGKPMTLNIRSSWSWWKGLLVLMSSWRQWKMGSDVSSSAKMQPIAQMSGTHKHRHS